MAHYCSSSKLDDSRLPSARAFLFRERDSYLSANWLEYFRKPDRADALECVRHALRDKGFTIRPTGRLAVLNVGAAKEAALGVGNRTFYIQYRPEPDDPSHAALGGYEPDPMLVALALQSLVRSENVYEAVATDTAGATAGTG